VSSTCRKKKSEPNRRGVRASVGGEERGGGRHIDELVRHHVRVEVRLLEDLLHRRRLGERVEERLASLAQRALHRLDDRHEEGAQEGWLLAHLREERHGARRGR